METIPESDVTRTRLGAAGMQKKNTAGFKVYFGLWWMWGVREREDTCEGDKQFTAHTSLCLVEGYRAADENEQASGNYKTPKDRHKLSHSGN